MNTGRIEEKYLQVLYVSIIILITAVVFSPSLLNGFIEWDDPAYVTRNEVIKSFSAQNLKKSFTSAFEGCYCPLVIMSYAAEYHFFKLNPFIYHLTNYLLHILITVSVFYFIYLLSGKSNIAFITAILFGIHPLHVESVAWISERKDLLYAIFYMLALIAYVIYLKRGRKKAHYLLCILFSTLSLASKPMAVTLPVILILLDYFCDRRIDRRAILEKLPIFALALVFGIINLHFQVLSGATKAATLDLGAKIYFFSKTLPFYLYKVFVPINLAIGYPYHSINPRHIAEIKYYILIIILLVSLIIFSGKYSKKVLFGSLFFIITILPVLKIIPAGDDFAADRYMYLPSIGIFYILAVFVDRVLHSSIGRVKAGKFAVFVILFLIFIPLSVLTWKRCRIWKDTETLFLDYLQKYPNAPVFYNILGKMFFRQGEVDKAIKYFERALIVNPNFKDAKRNLESVLKSRRGIEGTKGVPMTAPMEEGKDKAGEAEILNKLGVEEGKKGNFDKAISLFREALELNPDYAEAYNNLGYTYYKKDNYELAEKYFKKTLEIDPDHKKARINLNYILSLSDSAKRD